jgi:hypothetical protein
LLEIAEEGAVNQSLPGASASQSPPTDGSECADDAAFVEEVPAIRSVDESRTEQVRVHWNYIKGGHRSHRAPA